MFHDSHVVKNELFLNPSTSLLELSCVIFHLKAFHWNVAICGVCQWSKLSLYHLGGRSVLLFVDVKLAIVSVSGRLSPHNFEMFSISPLQAYSFRFWFSNNSVITFLEGCLAFSSPFFYFNYLSSILLFRRHCDVVPFNHHLVLSGSCSFHAYPFNRSVLPFSFKFFFILSSLASLSNRSAVRFWSSLFLVYLVSTRVISIPSCPLYLSFIALQPSSPRNVPCSSFLTDCLQSRSSLLYSFF